MIAIVRPSAVPAEFVWTWNCTRTMNLAVINLKKLQSTCTRYKDTTSVRYLEPQLSHLDWKLDSVMKEKRQTFVETVRVMKIIRCYCSSRSTSKCKS